MTKSSSTLSLIILSAVSILLLGALVFGVWSVRDKNQKISELLHLVEDAAEAEVLSQFVRTVRNNSAEEIAELESLVLYEDKLVPLIESMEEAGRSLGLDTNILSVAKTEDEDLSEPAVIRIFLETNGAWARTLAFLHAIESLPHRVMIDETSIIGGEDGWNSRIVLRVHMFN